MQECSRRRGEQRGFSFIEILIVMGIISVLVGGVIVAINMWAEKGPEFATKNTLNKTKALIEDWQRTFEFLPPDDVLRIAQVTAVGEKPAPPENRVNGPIEAVYQALFWPGFKSTDFNEDELGNTDEDQLRKAIGKATAELKEIVDGWKNPLIYIPAEKYGEYANGGPSYWTARGDDWAPKPYRKEDGTYVNPNSFQLFSMGPDGEPNTPDDVTSWSK